MNNEGIERRTSTGTLELRAGAGVGVKISGYAALFHKLSVDFGGFREKLVPGIFEPRLKAGDDVIFTLNHNWDLLMARTSSGTMRLKETATGLWNEIDVPDTSLGRDVVAAMRRGDLVQQSFSFHPDPSGDKWTKVGNEVVVEVSSIRKLIDTSIVAFGAYPQTHADVRSQAAELRYARSGSDGGEVREIDDSLRRIRLAEMDLDAAGDASLRCMPQILKLREELRIIKSVGFPKRSRYALHRIGRELQVRATLARNTADIQRDSAASRLYSGRAR